MTYEEVRRCQLKQLEALKFVDEICKKNHLRYFVHTGTLLGAIRHRGYIPWDMDTDILMPEEDTLLFIDAVKKTASPMFFLVSQFDSHSCCDRLFSRAAKCYGTAAFDEINKYIHIDIYSYGNARQHLHFLDNFYNYKTRLIHRLISYRRGRTLFQNKLYGKCIKLIDLLLHNYTNDQLRDKLKQDAVQESNTNKVSVFNSFYGFAKETYPRCYYESSILMPFEDMLVPVPKYYKDVLSRLYGEWQKLPPKEKRYPQDLNDLIYEEYEEFPAIE